jgi:hypothetical protein
MALKVNLRPEIERKMEELLPLSGARSKTEYINQAIRERNASLERRHAVERLRRYFERRGDELRAVNREMRRAARPVTDED